jgi:hypothetical protein
LHKDGRYRCEADIHEDLWARTLVGRTQIGQADRKQ